MKKHSMEGVWDEIMNHIRLEGQTDQGVSDREQSSRIWMERDIRIHNKSKV